MRAQHPGALITLDCIIYFINKILTKGIWTYNIKMQVRNTWQLLVQSTIGMQVILEIKLNLLGDK
jgi:hypothetical protein